jgi:hypothetical protein
MVNVDVKKVKMEVHYNKCAIFIVLRKHTLYKESMKYSRRQPFTKYFNKSFANHIRFV